MLRWTTRTLLLMTAGCSLPLATWVLLGRPQSVMVLVAGGCFFFGPVLYGLKTPTPASWRSARCDLTEQQPVFMGLGILLVALGCFLAVVLFARATQYAASAYPWLLILGSLILSGWVLGLAGGAVARLQADCLERYLGVDKKDQ